MDEIEWYLESLGIVGSVKEMQLKKYRRNPEIAEEFAEWIQKGEGRKANDGKFPDWVSYEGYNASAIKKLAPQMNGSGIYSFLVTLKENPELAKEMIAEGFPVY